MKHDPDLARQARHRRIHVADCRCGRCSLPIELADRSRPIGTWACLAVAAAAFAAVPGRALADLAWSAL